MLLSVLPLSMHQLTTLIAIGWLPAIPQLTSTYGIQRKGTTLVPESQAEVLRFTLMGVTLS